METTSAILRSRSQTIAEDRTMFYLKAGFHMIADDRRHYCDLRSYGNQPLTTFSKSEPETSRCITCFLLTLPKSIVRQFASRIRPSLHVSQKLQKRLPLSRSQFFKIIVCCQFRTVYSDLIFAWFARLRGSNFKMRDSETSFIFSSSRFRDSSLRRRDFETRLKFAETHYF